MSDSRDRLSRSLETTGPMRSGKIHRMRARLAGTLNVDPAWSWRTAARCGSSCTGLLISVPDDLLHFRRAKP